LKLFKFFLKAKKNNKGYSLVEVIVAMLVLAIAAVPLLMGFSVVSNNNVKTRKSQYANTVATNVLEAIKQFGIENTALQMHERENFRLVTGITRGNYGECLKDFETVLIYGSNNFENNPLQVGACIYPYPGGNMYKFMPRLTTKENNDDYNNNYVRKYYFFINGIQEGTMLYDAQITFDATTAAFQGTTENPNSKNDFDLSNLGTLNSKKSALIAPSGVWYSTITDEVGDEAYDITKTFESEALKTFIDRYFEYQSSRFNKARELATLTNEVVRKAINKYQESLGSNLGAAQFFGNFLFVAADKDTTDKTMADHGTTGKVTQTDIDTAISLRTLAFNYYKSTYEDEWKTYEEAGVTLDPTTTTIVDVDSITEDQYNPLKVQKTDSNLEAKFIKLIDRATNVDIKVDGTNYVVTSETVFTIDQSAYEPDNPLLTDPLKADATDAEKQAYKDATTYTGSGYFEEVGFSAIENIYIFQDAARAGNYKSDSVYINSFDVKKDGNPTTILNSYGETSKINLYMVWQYQNVGSDGTIADTLYSDNVNLVFGGTTEQAKQFTVYSQTHPTFTTKLRSSETATPIAEAALVSSKDGIVSNLENSDRAYTVTVTILEHGTDNVVYTQSTTIKE